MTVEFMRFYRGHTINRCTIGQRVFYTITPIETDKIYYPDSDDVKPIYDHEYRTMASAKMALRSW